MGPSLKILRTLSLVATLPFFSASESAFAANKDGALASKVMAQCSQSLGTEKGQKVLQGIEVSSTAVCTNPLAATQPAPSLLKLSEQLTGYGETESVNQMYEQVIDTSLQTSMTAMMIHAANYGQNGKVPDFSKNNPNAAREALDLYVKAYPGFTKLNEVQRKQIAQNIGKALAQFRKIDQAKPVRPKHLEDPRQMESYLANLKTKITKINQACSGMRKRNANETTQIREDIYGKNEQTTDPLKIGIKTLANDQTSTRGFQQRVQRNLEYNSAQMNLLQNSPAIKADLNDLFASEYGTLFITDTFQENVGNLKTNFLSTYCLSGNGVLLAMPTASDVKKAIKEVETLSNQELNQVTQHKTLPPSQNTVSHKEEILKDYIADNPLVVSDFLKKHSSANDAKVICKLVQEIDQSEKWHNYYKKGLMVGGAIVGAAAVVASGGTAAPLVGALAMGVTVASAADALGSYQEAKSSYARVQKASATRQSDTLTAQQRLGEEKDKKTEAGQDFLMTVGAEAGGALIGAGLKSAKSAKTGSEASRYFEHLPSEKAGVWNQFKKEVNFDQMSSVQQKELQGQFYKTHLSNNSQSLNTVEMGKKRDLVANRQSLNDRLVSQGVDPAEAKRISHEQIRKLGDHGVLGETPTSYQRQYDDSLLANLKTELKSNTATAEATRKDYQNLLEYRKKLLPLSTTDSKARAALKAVDGDLENIEAVYPRANELKEMKAQVNTPPATTKVAAKPAPAQPSAPKATPHSNEPSQATLEYRQKNANYAQVRSNYNAERMDAWASDMKRNGVTPRPTEVDKFVTDTQNFLKTEPSATTRWSTVDDVVDVLSRTDAPKVPSSNVSAFKGFTQWIQDRNMPSPTRLFKVMDRQFDFTAIGKKMSVNEINELRSFSSRTSDPSAKKIMEEVLERLGK